jgi:hypothetical protein
VVEIIV